MLNSRKLEDLDPEAREVCARHVALCHQAGIEIIVTSTYRDFAAQDALYAIGRTVQTERHAVTNAKAGHSWHNYKCAWDVVPLIGGKAVWNANDPVWKEVIRLGKEAGAEAGAEWKSFPDLPHFQFKPAQLTLDQAMIRFEESGSIFV